MFSYRCSLIKQINTTVSEHGTTTKNLLTKVTNSSVIILQYIGCIEAVIDLCISLFLTTFNKDDDDDDDDDGLSH